MEYNAGFIYSSNQLANKAAQADEFAFRGFG